jgi:AraC-like DNA-binding protein
LLIITIERPRYRKEKAEIDTSQHCHYLKSHLHIPVNAQLREYISFIWEIEGGHSVHETILPQGAVEIIFNFAGVVTGIMPFGQEAIEAPRCFAQGVNTHIVQAAYSGQHHLFGIRLLAHRVQDLLGILPSELNNSTVDLTLIKPWFNELWHQLVEAGSFDARVSILQAELPVLSQAACQRSQRLSHLFSVDGMEAFQTVDDLAKEVCYSSRQLNRVAHNLFGLSAEELTGYKKFLEGVKLIHTGSQSLTGVAYQSGFYDQSHFCRTFKAYAGMTPKQYEKNKSTLPFHLFS